MLTPATPEEVVVRPEADDGVLVALSGGARANPAWRRTANLARELCRDVRTMRVTPGGTPLDPMFDPMDVDATLGMLGCALALGPAAGGWLETVVVAGEGWSSRFLEYEASTSNAPADELAEPPRSPTDARRLRRAELLGERLNAPVVAVHALREDASGPLDGPFPCHSVAVSYAPAGYRERRGHAWAWLHARASAVVVARLTTATALLDLARSQHIDVVPVGLRRRSWLDGIVQWFAAGAASGAPALSVHLGAARGGVRRTYLAA